MERTKYSVSEKAALSASDNGVKITKTKWGASDVELMFTMGGVNLTLSCTTAQAIDMAHKLIAVAVAEQTPEPEQTFAPAPAPAPAPVAAD